MLNLIFLVLANSNPLVTIIIPCYNASPYIHEAVDSIINQSYKNLEIICINDCSCDNTGQILDKYAKEDPRIVVVYNERNLKLIKTLNNGIDLASGDFIARMDADDISHPLRIEKQLGFLLSNENLDAVSCAAKLINEKGDIIGQSIVRNVSDNGSLLASFYYNPIIHPGVLIRTKVLKENKYKESPESLHVEDYELWSRLIRKGYRVGNISEPLLYYRVNSTSVSRVYEASQKKNFIICNKMHYEDFFKRKIDINVAKVLSNRLDSNTSTLNWIKGIFLILKIPFILEKINNDKWAVHKRENFVIVCTHLMDVLIQSFKLRNVFIKVLSFLLMGIVFLSLIDSKVRLHFFEKFNRVSS